MTTWPETILPLPSVNYKSDTTGNLLVQQMEVGTRQRRRFSKDIEMVSVVWNFTQIQYSYFRTFVHETLEQGSKPISITLLTSNGLERVNARIIGGEYSSAYKAFRSYDVSAKLEIIDPPNLDPTNTALIAFLDGDRYADQWITAVNKLYKTINDENIVPTH